MAAPNKEATVQVWTTFQCLAPLFEFRQKIHDCKINERNMYEINKILLTNEERFVKCTTMYYVYFFGEAIMFKTD